MAKGKKWLFKKEFDGFPTDENLELVEFDLPEKLEENGKNNKNAEFITKAN